MKHMIRSRKPLVFVAAVVFFFSLSMTGFVTETNAQACYVLYHTWDFCALPSIAWDSTLLLVYGNGTFDDLGGGYGYWGWYGKSLFLQYETGCEPFYSGTKKQGNKQCTDGNFPGSLYSPGCWYLKKSKNCFFLLDKDGAESSGTGGGETASLTSGSIRPSK